GTVGNDTLEGDEGDDTLRGEDGDDTYNFSPGSGFDFGTDTVYEDSSAGTDTLDFTNLHPPTGVNGATVTLATSSQQTVTTNQLRLILSGAANIENIAGSNFGKDSLTGNSLANSITRGDDNDT